MNTRNEKLVQSSLLVAGLIVVAVLISVVRTTGQANHETDNDAKEQWEYLAVAGPSSTNFTPTGNPKMRKESNAAFAREAFVLEQHMDKLGANGWELVTVAGPPTEPVYYFKKRK